MFLFRKNAEPAEDAGDHEPVDVTNAAQDADAGEERYNEEEEEEQEEAYHGDDGEQEHEPEEEPEEYQEEEEEGDVHAAYHHDDDEVAEDAPHTAREGTVPPLEERHIAQQHQRDVEAEEEADAHAAAPSHSAPSAAMPALAMPRTSAAGHGSGSPHSTTNVMRRSSRGTTPRAALSPRGHSYAGSALSAEEVAVVEQEYRRCSSVVQSARNIAARRASSVNYLVGNIDGGAGLAERRRSGSMTAAEREAVEHMMDSEFHRQEAAERSAQFSRIREATLVEVELAKERASHDHLIQQEQERHAEIGRRSSLRAQRMSAAAARREAMEQQRQEAVLQSVSTKDARYTMRDPYTVVAAQRRYRSPIAPSRRTSSPAMRGDRDSSRRPSGHVNGNGSRTHSPSADYRRNSAPDSNARAVKPGIDMTRPRQCLPLNAWKTPEQLRRKERAGTNVTRCLPPGAWEAPTVVDHSRQWH